jgi:hypothetical protein
LQREGAVAAAMHMGVERSQQRAAAVARSVAEGPSLKATLRRPSERGLIPGPPSASAPVGTRTGAAAVGGQEQHWVKASSSTAHAETFGLPPKVTGWPAQRRLAGERLQAAAPRPPALA